MTDRTRVLIHLNLITGVGAATIEKLIRSNVLVPDDSMSIYRYTVQDFMHMCALSESAARLLADGLASRDMLLLCQREFDLVNKHGISVVTIFDEHYPVLLKNTHLPPPVLYVRGDLSSIISQTMIAFVGSRKADNYCQRAAQSIIPDLVAQGFCIVSGGALGADTMAHSCALDAGGQTIAVIGSGLLCPYPAQNRRLFDCIAQKQGAILSPFGLNMPAQPGNFPARNRIISGMSCACIVLQAAQKSGALITASFALNEGREIGAVPGSIDNVLSAGCFELLKQGAHVITCAQDVCNAIGYGSKIQQKLVLEKKQIQTSKIDPIVSFCQQPISFDDLLEKVDCDAVKLQTELCKRQLAGLITQNIIGLWQAVL